MIFISASGMTPTSITDNFQLCSQNVELNLEIRPVRLPLCSTYTCISLTSLANFYWNYTQCKNNNFRNIVFHGVVCD